MSNSNGKFLRGVFWALLIGSFGWTTFVGYGLLMATASTHSTAIALAETTENKAIILAKTNAERAEKMREEYISRDEQMLALITKEFKEINAGMAEQRTDIKWIKERMKR